MKLRRILGELFAQASFASIIAGVAAVHAHETPEEPEPYAMEVVDASAIDTSSPSFVQVIGKAAPLQGLIDACDRGVLSCDPAGGPAKAVVANEKNIQAVTASNFLFNEVRGQATDLEIHGKEEYWTTGEESQDCEDGKIELRDYLHVRYGIPYEAMTFVRVDTEVIEETGKREGHLVLMIRFTDRDRFLDNRYDKVMNVEQMFPVDGSGYILRTMSSFENILKWKELEDTRNLMPAMEGDPIKDLIEGEKFSTKATFPYKPPVL